MAGVPIVIIGTIKSADGTESQVTITGIAGLAGYAPGHPLPPAGPGKPPGTWGGSGEPFPTPPIAFPPGWVGGVPPGIWGGGNQPFPTPPIAFPPGWVGGVPPEGGGEPKPPMFEWKIGWTPETGWGIVAVPQFPHPSPSGS